MNRSVLGWEASSAFMDAAGIKRPFGINGHVMKEYRKMFIDRLEKDEDLPAYIGLHPDLDGYLSQRFVGKRPELALSWDHNGVTGYSGVMTGPKGELVNGVVVFR